MRTITSIIFDYRCAEILWLVHVKIIWMVVENTEDTIKYGLYSVKYEKC